ncbi:hypothetical protein [Inediibacterium massiliense]|uniref:hypothetical protein n=1 Tax=Inediibacterium massiliense TaxID=1658111 RepID=UPI0006B4BA2C|nr:hypothetical protein [Inediibacterium massiliense]
MINLIIIQGSKSTTLHDFKITTKGMKLQINGTHYTAGNQEIFTNYIEEMTTVKEKVWNEELQDFTEIEKQVPTGKRIQLEGVEVEIQAGFEYEVWICEDGIVILTKEMNNPESQFDKVPDNVIDRLAWFSVPLGTNTLDDVEINAIEIREE